MKTALAILVALCASTYWISAQTASSSSPTATGQVTPSDTPWAVAKRDGSSSVWQKTTYEVTPDGRQIPHLHKYIELADGLNYLSNGQWVESKEQIDILPNGTAAATHLQSPVYFPSDIASGVIRLITPEGAQLQNGPAFLDFDDGTNIVLIGATTNSVGELVSSNQVLYPDIFRGSGFRADLLCTVRKSGFESDLVFREQIPDPTSLGLGANARLQLLTEWYGTPEPAQTIGARSTSDGLTDSTLRFGSTTFGRGKAFVIGTSNAQARASTQKSQIPVYKSWLHLNGRKFLVEEVPYDRMAPQLEQLPAPASTAVSMNSARSVLHRASATRLLPPTRVAQANTNGIQLAKADLGQQRGVVLDYVTISTDETNYVFQGDLTYYISGPINLSGTNTIEGGTVIKMPDQNADPMNADPIVVGATDPNACIVSKAQPYRMAVLTSMDDNSVGETIAGSTGNPTETGVVYLWLYPNLSPSTLAYLRFLYANAAIVQWSNGATNFSPVWNCQFINCGNVIEDVPYNSNGPLTYQGLYNVLISNCGTGVTCSSGQLAFNGVNVTADQVNEFLVTGSWDTYAINYSSLTNSILTGVQHQIYLVDQPSVVVTLSNTACFFSSSNGIYQTVGAGSYYLLTNCPAGIRNAGTMNIDPRALADIRTKTTYPPIVYSNVTFSVATNFSPQAQRDTNSAPDLGYHYDPLDYVFGGCDLYTNLTLAPSTVLGWYEDYGGVYVSGQPYAMSLNNGANLTGAGTATQPVWITHALNVQEGGNGNWTGRGYMAGIAFNGDGSGSVPQINAQFTKWCGLSSAVNIFQDNWAYGVGHFSDCELYNSGIISYRPSLYFTNCLFFRTGIAFWSQLANPSFTFQNCTFYNGFLATVRKSWFSPAFWTVSNTAFDGTGFAGDDYLNGDTNYTAFDYNAYNSANLSWQTYPYGYPPIYGTLETNGPHTVPVPSGYNWQSSWLGNYYQPANSPLLHMGSTTADQIGLYHFTVMTNQIAEGTNTVSIGYHYVAVDQYGNPQDSNGDGIPDYLEDPLGNGLPYNGTNWALAILSQPQNQTAIQGSNATFSVTAGGVAPLSYQWYSNSSSVANATNSILILSNVQTGNAGNYYVIVANNFGSVTSSAAILTVLVPPTVVQQPTNQALFSGSNATFSVTATGTLPLTYQWLFNGTNLFGATNASLILTNVQVANVGNYSVVVTNTAGSTISSNATLSLLGPPLIVQQPANQVVPQSSNVTFTVQATGTAPLYYQWLKNGLILTNSSTVSGANANALILTGLKPWNQGLYNVIVSNSIGQVTSLYAIRVLSPSIAVGWGDNTCGQISGPSNLINVAAVAVPNFYSLALDARGSVFGWGRMLGCEYASATLNGISGAYNSGDALAPGALLSLNNKIDGCILSAVDGNNNPIGAWPPAPVAAQNAQQFSLSLSGVNSFYDVNTYYCHNGFFIYYGGGETLASGDNITIGGVSCAVDGYGANANGVVTSMTCHPNQDSTYGQTIAGAINQPNAHTVPVNDSTHNPTVCPGGSTTVFYVNTSSLTGNIGGSYSANPSTYPHGYIPPQPNYITLTLSQNFSGNIGDTLQVGNALMTVTSTNGNKVTCQMQNNNVQGQGIPFISSPTTIPTSAQILMDNSANGSLTTMATYPLNNGAIPPPNTNANYPIVFSMAFPNPGIPASGIVPSPSTNTIQPGTIVQITNPGGSGVAGSGDLLFVTVVVLSSNSVGPVNIPTDMTNVAAIAASPNSIGYDDFGLALKNNGTVESWDLAGVLAVPSSVTNIVAIAAGDRHSLALKVGGTVVAWGDNTYGQTNVPANATNVVAIDASTYYSLALRSNGTVVAWGYNIQTNVPANATNVVAIAAGFYHSLALKSNGTVVAWKAWSTGVSSVTNVPANATNVVAIAAGNGYSFALKSDGTVVSWGTNAGTNVPSGLTNIAAMAAGNYDNMAVMMPMPPLISQQPANYAANLGGSALFSVIATSMVPLSYQWLFNSTNLIGATNASLTLNNVQTNNAGIYSVVVTNVAGSVTSSNALLTVPLSPTITQQPTNYAANVGSNAIFSVVISTNSATPLSYQWLFNGTNLIGATSASLTLNNVQANNAGIYSVIVTNVAGSVTSVNVNLTVLPPISWFQQYWGINYQTNSNANPYADPDGDGLSNIGEYLAGTNPTNFDQVMLGSWRFNTTNWVGDQWQLPLYQTGLTSALVPGMEGNAVDMTGSNYSKMLSYRYADIDGNLNITLQSGTVIFWFKPSWSGTNEGGAGPGSIGRLINIGTWTANATNGVWMINLDTSGDLISLDVQDNAGHEVQIPYVSIPGGMVSNQWVQIAVTYTPTNTAFYVDGALAGTGGGLNYVVPPQNVLSNGFDIGTDAQGAEMSLGAFDLLQTFNYPLAAAAIQANFQSAFTLYPNADPDGDGIPNAWESALGLNPLVNDWAQSGSRLNYGYTLADWLNQVSGIRSGSINLDAEGNVLTVPQ